MATQQIEQMVVGGRRKIGIGMGIALMALVALMVAGRLAMPMPAQPTGVSAAEQPSIGRSSVVTGLVFDGTRYTTAPIAVGAKGEQPAIGSAMTVIGLVFNGTRYTSAPIAVAAPSAGRGYAVTAMVFDGMTYRTAPVQVGGR
jgi:hypothetical protein